ncbi:hypothetical protein LZ30DRAFT_408992 [Colletotrichum cereale]|nr:hypothetical protein LZ30DRAFT_408992 [Colletotrichum cereale]
MDDQTAELGPYIARCHSNYTPVRSFNRNNRIFKTENQPLLRRGRMNRVIVYPGCFNPPHLGHYNMLRRAFEGSRDINVVAAVVFPLNDSRLEGKYAMSDGLILSKAERVRLWRSDARFMPEWWVYDGDEGDWYALRDDLEEAIERDGFEIQFSSVLGPDHIGRFTPYCGQN